MPASLETPVAIICFNRPEATARLLRRLAGLRPRRIFVICDGPRLHVPGDEAAVSAVRGLFDRLPWPCEVLRDFAADNLGCRKRVVSGLDWVFSHAERAIILEDDCLPTTSFFPYCEELLARYADDPRIGSICGMTHDSLIPAAAASYRFSRYCFVWGWATWRRAWRLYDPAMSPLHDGSIDPLLQDTFGSLRARLYWKMIFQRCASGRIDTWDYQWLLTCWQHGLIHVTPSVTLVENIGVGPDSTHTKKLTHDLTNILTMTFPLVHPQKVATDRLLDDRVENLVFSRDFVNRLKWAFRKYLP